LVLNLSVWAGIHTYADQSVLAEGKWVKIRVSETGVCRMSFSQIKEAGLDPQQLRVYGYGGAQLEQSFLKRKIDDLPQVPVYVGADYVLFYVQGPISWSFNGTRFVHTRNTYSDYGYYLLTDNVGSLLPFPESEPVTGTPTELSSYINYQVHDYDSLNLVDRSGVSGGGRTFYGEQFRANQTRTFYFSTPNAIEGEINMVRIEVAAYSSIESYFRASINKAQEDVVYIKKIEGLYAFGETGTINSKKEAKADRQEVSLTLQNSSSSALGWLNYIEIATPTALKMVGNQMPIRTNVNYQTTVPVRFHLTGADANTQIWDVTRRDAITRMPATLTGNELVWTGTQNDFAHEYVAVNPNGSQWVAAEIVGEVKNQNLHALKNIDYVIICPEGYEEIATDLAKEHEARQAITWAVVTDQQVYNEFSSGTPDATAYRWLMKMLYDRADGNAIQKPRWLLLLGHGSFDNRNICKTQNGSVSGTKFLLTYQAKNSENEVYAYCTDDYFAFLDDSEGESDTQGRMDIGVGRLPVESKEEARTTVDKMIRYLRNEQVGKWKNQIMYLADDGEGGTHTKTAEESAELMRIKNLDFIVNKIYLDAYPQEVNASGESYPLAKNRVTNLLRNGVLFFGYSGHGGYNAITNESILNIKDIEAMSNKNMAFWLFVTCNFAQCDAGKRSSAESAVLNPNGGAIGVLAATRTVYAGPNTELYRSVTDTLFGHKNSFHYDMTLGEAIAIGKNRLGSDMNKMAYVLLGDPAMRLNYPTDYQVQTTTKMDTLNALSVQHVEGRIIDEDLQTVTDFNGQVDVTIYDKLQVITTRDNDAKEGEEVEVQNYNDYPNTIFTGSTTVKEGLFNYTFMVPKDIRYNYGNGRIVYYAVTTGEGEKEEAVGHFEQFIVGGTGKILSADTVGPEMTIYLNTKSFRNGDKTYATPRFFADLYDENGINTAGAGIGHDLLLTIDNDSKRIYSLNEYFMAANNSYQSGQVSYLMEELPNGPHTLTFRAWDLLNNSTSKSLSFVVEAGLDPSIHSVTTYPNPVQEQGIVNIIVDYDQPDELLSTELYLYTMSGQVVWTHKQDNPDQVAIRLSDLGLNAGVYTYVIKIKSASSKYSTTAGKIIVTK
jgi:hypothetical protein